MRVAIVRHPVATRPLGPVRGTVLFHLGLGLLLALAALLVGALPAGATVRPWVDRTSTAGAGPLDVSVRIGSSTTPLYRSSGAPDRWYLEAREGARYQITVRNTTGERIAFLMAVDGLNVINGQLSRLSSDEPMYVLDPYGQATIQGWRKDLRNVSRFVFVDEERSYAERTGQGNGQLGWIRVLAFRERDRRPLLGREKVRPYEYDGRDEFMAPKAEAPRIDGALRERAATPQLEGLRDDRAGGPVAQSNPGTGWGENQRDPVRWVDFQPERQASAQVILRYEYRSALISLGILPWRGPARDRLGERERGWYGFAQPPTR